MKHLKLYEEFNLNWFKKKKKTDKIPPLKDEDLFDDDNWDEEETDKTKYRIVTLNYAGKHRMLQFKKGKKWYYIPNGEYLQIYKVYKPLDNFGNFDHDNPFRYLFANMDNVEKLKKWAKDHPYIEEYLKKLEDEYDKIFRKERRERRKQDNLDNGDIYLEKNVNENLEPFGDEDWDDEEFDDGHEEENNIYNINKIIKFENDINGTIAEMEELFDDGYGDQLEEPTDANISEQMDELVKQYKLSKYDIIEMIKRNNINGGWVRLLNWYLEDDIRTYNDDKNIRNLDIPKDIHYWKYGDHVNDWYKEWMMFKNKNKK